ncbi:Protein Rf1, mitochondrial [Triticum urartu]|uniref:Protein Rf1, mitochondrial n=1 Tax=Triticum urartu TaxID=4572 RepID=M7Z668_TRIUA|nr:Protein Rf1, mitochondrial [Triticum urartu]
MSRLRLLRRSSSSTTLIPRLRLLRRCSTSTSTSPPSGPWSPRDAFVAAIERVRAGTLSPEDAHHLFDDLLGQATPVPDRTMNGFFAVLARATSPAACIRDGPALAVALFNRVPRRGRTGLKANEIVATTFLKCLCCAKRTEEAVKVLLHRMPELGCVPNAISYSIVLKSLCENSMSQQALDLLQMAAKEGGCLPDVVAYSTIIHGFFKEGEIDKACHLFHEMMRQGVVPTVVTYNIIIDALCKAGEMDKAELVFQRMARNGAQPNKATCNGSKFSSLTDGYCSVAKMDKTFKLLDAMRNVVRVKPTTVTYGIILDGLYRAGRTAAAKEMFHQMIKSGITVPISIYTIILRGLCKNNCAGEAITMFQELRAMNVKFDIITLNTMINAMYKVQRREEAKGLFAAISASGLMPDAYTYNVMINNLLKEGSVEEVDNMFSLMEKSGCAPSSHLVNDIIRRLLEKGEIAKAGNYLSKVDGKIISLEDSTTSLLSSLFSSKGKYRENIKLLPANYHFLDGFSGIAHETNS